MVITLIITLSVFIILALVYIDIIMRALKSKNYYKSVMEHSIVLRIMDKTFNQFFEWRLWKKIIPITFFSIIFLSTATYLYIQFALPKVPPVPQITIDHKDSKLLERGEYLVEAVVICTDCHSPRDVNYYSWPVIKGKEGAGGPFLSQKDGYIFPGESFTPNITPANLGNWTDGEIYRLLTTGIRKDGSTVYHAMPYKAFSKADPNDLKAIIAYLRTLKPIHNEPAGKTEINFPERVFTRTISRKVEPTNLSKLQTDVEQGEYLVTLAACKDCHTPKKWLDMFDEKRAFSGGIQFPMPTGGFVYSANLTPDESGLKDWSEEAFVNRFKSYRDSTAIHKIEPNSANSLMPWFAYRNMKDEDLRKIFAYLKTLKPIYNPVTKFSVESLEVKKSRMENE